MLVYGRNVAKEILGKNKKVEKIILQEGFDDKEINSLIENGNFRVEFKQKRDIDRLADGVHQGIILYIPDYKYKTLNEVLENEPQFLVLLDHLEDPHNLGAIIRTSEAAGVDAIIMPKDRQVMINSTVMKTSVGTLDNMDVVAVTNLVQTIEELNSLEEQWQKQNEICSTFGKLKKFLLDVEGKMQQAEKADKETIW